MSGGGSGGGSEPDREYNARMATIAESQQAMAEEMYQYWKSGPGHWETQTVGGSGYTATGAPQASTPGIRSAFDSLVPKTEKVWVKDKGGVSYQQMEQAQMKANMELIPKQTGLMSVMLDNQTKIAPKYFDEAMKGVNVGERVSLARADVESEYANAEKNMRRMASTTGINPASNRYLSGLADLSREKAAAKVGATSLARRQAEEENFLRLSGAMGLSAA